MLFKFKKANQIYACICFVNYKLIYFSFRLYLFFLFSVQSRRSQIQYRLNKNTLYPTYSLLLWVAIPRMEKKIAWLYFALASKLIHSQCTYANGAIFHKKCLKDFFQLFFRPLYYLFYNSINFESHEKLLEYITYAPEILKEYIVN